ncbi:helix-turn-helix domain-containing protein [Roseofilum sp. BLCC_M154]|uniref:Helix-turn-helix domain-containing protein n=1 Tax=Roseofilum acuticapitatum BLCC-M154 TaxID=3022444 RepID=A0ABT7AVZ2_9CYAN|nr:helix-turn-helix domain-containing protein [Roseofilum acuticapitatum]MDJ1171087.1 helix-turn-helix domain-containing protein [Roseofilum acuticapitatum BLCC-M154]
MTNSPQSLSVQACAILGLSPKELRQLLSQMEAQLHHSPVYRRTLESLHSQSGEGAEGMQMLIKAMGREAIQIALQHLVNEYQRQLSEPLRPSTAIAPVTTPQSSTKPSTAHSPKTVPVNSGLASSTQTPPPRPQKLSKVQLAQQKKQQERETGWKKIGEQLQKARLGRNLSLDQLHALTRIPIHELKALETGDFEHLPEEIYLHGFVRRLSIILGLDSQHLLSTLPEPDVTHSVIPSWSSLAHQKSKGFYLQPAHLYLGYTALMASAVGGLAWLYGDAPSGAAQETPPEAPEFSIPDSGQKSYAAESLSNSDLPAPEMVSDPQ